MKSILLATQFRLLILCVCLSLLFAAVPVPLRAQQNASGSISGTVLDPDGNAVQNAVVAVRSESSAAVTKAVTDPQGKFSVADLPAGSYTVEVAVPGFALAARTGVRAGGDQTAPLSIALVLGSVSDAITVEANASGSLAAQHAPMDGLLEARSARTEVTPVFIQNFTSPVADFGELIEMAPGTFSINSNGIGLGQDKTYFRGFPDGDYDIDFDGVPFYDTNSPTHHSWAFFPEPWVGSVDFDRSPGSASTIGPTPFGGSIHLLSPPMGSAPAVFGSVSYGSFNTILIDGTFNSGPFWGKKSNFTADVQHMTSDGYETDNFQTRNAGSLKYVYKFSENNVLTGFSGVVWLDSNTPNNNPTRGQIAQYGYNFLLTKDSNAAELNSSGNCISTANCLYPLNYQFYTYHVPTDVEYVDWSKQYGRGWQTDFKPYTLSYYNAQFYNNSLTAVNSTSAVDKLNSYRKYGESFVASQVSKYGIFRTGLWYEWATTNRFQIPSNPLTHADTFLANFHESFFTHSAQPFVEYEWHATPKFIVTGGFKYSFFDQNLTQFQDNGKIVGCLGGKLVGGKTGTCVGGLASVNHSAGYSSYLPSFDANYHLTNNWSVYGQFGTGAVVPPSSVFDVTGANVVLTPKPTTVRTYQGGSVLKLKQVTLNADVYYARFQNAYSSVTDPNNTTGFDWVSSGDSVTKGFEGEVNVYVTRGFSFYVNGTAGSARYASDGFINKSLWVANTPSDTEAVGLTYQQKHFDLGIFDKRVGPMWNDNTPFNQVIPIAPFNLTNVYLNYVLKNGSHFDQTTLRLSVNNLFNAHNIVGVQQAAAGATYNPGPGDLLSLLPGRSIAMTVTVGYEPRGGR